MYRSPFFEEEDSEKVLAFMFANPFITLIGNDGEFPVATQVPVIVKRIGDMILLVGHIMRKSDHFRAFSINESVMALFSCSHAYISASVYEKPSSVSTWNYLSVQAKGRIKMLDEAGTYQAVKDLTDIYESPDSSPAAFGRMDKDYIKKHLKAIVGFELEVLKLDHTFKLSQNHSAQNRKGIINKLLAGSDMDIALAQEMEKQQNDPIEITKKLTNDLGVCTSGTRHVNEKKI